MEEKLKDFVDSLFEGAPLTREVLDVKEQTLANAKARYDELLNEGKSENTAFNIAVSEIGDVSAKINAASSGNAGNSSYSSRKDYDDFQSLNTRKIIRKSASTALWMIVIIAYFLISFTTHAWYITWLTFLIGVALEQILKICFELGKK